MTDRLGRAVSLVLVSVLLGCGTRVPPLTEGSGSNARTQQLIQGIVHSVDCEIFNAVRDTLGMKQYPKDPAGVGSFMYHWGAEVLLTLQIDEVSALNPNAVWLVPGPAIAIFTLGGGFTLSAHATRTEKLNFFYSVDSIRKRPKGTKCVVPPSNDSLLIQSDLGLYDWLSAEVIAVGDEEIGAPSGPDSVFRQNVLSHEVKFDILTSGNITPAFRLVRATFNQSGLFFNTSRERVHDLLITFGPIDPKTVNGLVPSAENAHLASQINVKLNPSQ